MTENSNLFDLIIFGDEDLTTPFTAPHRFAQLLKDGLVLSSRKVMISAPARTETSSYLKKTISSVISIARCASRAKVSIYYGQRAGSLVALRIRTWWLRERLVILLVEWPSAVRGRSLLASINARAFCSLVFRLSDGAIVISSKLREIAENAAHNLPILRIPPMVKEDAVQFETYSRRQIRQPRIVYCADLEGYAEDTELIVRASSTLGVPHSLILIGRASNAFRDRLRELHREINKGGELVFRSALSDDQLREEYMSASALMLPLDDSLRSQCRFPSKLPEYLAAGSPIITRRVGEIEIVPDGLPGVYYAESHNAWSYSSLMEHVLTSEIDNGVMKRQKFAVETFGNVKVGRAVSDFVAFLETKQSSG